MDEKLKDKIYNDKINKIEMLLDNENELDKYINKISNTEVSYSNELEKKILAKVSKKKSVYYINICKMVACMIVAIILCQTDYIKGTDIKSNNKENNKNQEIVQGNMFINNKVNQISDFFMKPIIIEKGEK